MLDVHTQEHGYTEVYVPYMVNARVANGVSSLAKFKDDLFKIEGRDLYLIPTAEYPVTNLVRDEIVARRRAAAEVRLPLAVLPQRGGLVRQGHARHDPPAPVRQGRARADRASASSRTKRHEELTRHAETILKRLELPYRTVTLCTGDMGFSAAKTYDLEVWLPGQNAYREISSCSNFEAFQARRMQARFRNEKGQDRARAHAQRLGPRGRAHARRGAGELPARRRRRRRAGGAAALHGRAGRDHSLASLKPRA